MRAERNCRAFSIVIRFMTANDKNSEVIILEKKYFKTKIKHNQASKNSQIV